MFSWWVFTCLFYCAVSPRCLNVHPFGSCSYSTTLSGLHCFRIVFFILLSQREGELSWMIGSSAQSLCSLGVRHFFFFFCRSAPVSNSNSHCTLLLSFKVCGLEKEKEESEVPKVESILKEPRRESRWERRWKEDLPVETMFFSERKVRCG